MASKLESFQDIIELQLHKPDFTELESKDSVEMNQCYPSLNYPIISNCRVKMLQLQCKWLQPWPRGGNHRLHDNNNDNSNSNNKERKNNKYSYRYRMIQDIHTFKIIQILEII